MFFDLSINLSRATHLFKSGIVIDQAKRISAIRKLQPLASLLCLSLSLSACLRTSDDLATETSSEEDVINVGRESGGAIAPSPNPSYPQGMWSFSSAMGTTSLDLGESVELRLEYLVNGVTPLVGRRITFELIDLDQRSVAVETGGASLGVTHSITDERGEASVTLSAGQTAASFFVRASDESAPDVATHLWLINIFNTTFSTLEVSVEYDSLGRYSPDQLHSAQVYLFQQVSCASLKSNAPVITGYYTELPLINPYSHRNQSVESEPLSANLTLSVVALILGSNGAPITFGCVEGVQTDASQQLSTRVITSDLPLEMNGLYTAFHRFDLIESLSNKGHINEIIDVIRFIQAIGGDYEGFDMATAEMICELGDLEQSLCDMVRSLLMGEIAMIFNQQIPPNVRSILLVLGSIFEIVGELKFVGEFNFFVLDTAEPTTPIQHKWSRILTPEECDFCPREISFDQLSRDGFSPIEMNLQRGSSGRIDILAHPFDLKYGDIALGLLESWIIPIAYGDASGNPIRLDDFLSINLDSPCDYIEQRYDILNYDECLGTFAMLPSRLLYAWLDDLNFLTSRGVLSGSFLPVDTDGDFLVDQIEGGVWSGVIDDSTYFKGCFSACRGVDCQTSTCQILD